LQTKELKSEILWEDTVQRTVKNNSGKELDIEMTKEAGNCKPKS